MAPTLTRKPKDAAGQPLDTSALYRPVEPFSASIDGEPITFNADTRLVGSHSAVKAHADKFVNAGTDPNEVARLSASRLYGYTVEQHQRPRPPEIPATHRAYARAAFTTGDGEYVPAGRAVDDRTELVRKHPEFFERRTSLADELAPPEAA
jgi:hypothetical protein